ncbi:MAG TPA: Gfo/Idh/MocA family oxidoreductase [Gemmataceae bacterium]|jgi:predicted dehydrogenase|nr:Gfo/Idh/MocA family oxidoreductase [Gemmataceae bacterium]
MSADEAQRLSRREAPLGAAAVGLPTATHLLPVATASGAADEKRSLRLGIIKAARGNGHIWHFLQGFHEKVDMEALAKYQGKEMVELYRKWLRNPKIVGEQPPFKDTQITHVYDKDAEAAKQFAAVFTGAQPVDKVEKMVRAVDAVLLGDDIGNGQDHLDLIAPALEAGLPTFCDIPLADTPARAREIIALAEKHKAPLMSSSLFRHFAEVLEIAAFRQSGEQGALGWLTVGYSAASIDAFLPIYGIHPVRAVAGIAGAGFEGVSLVRHEGAGLLTLTFKDRPPATVWMGGEKRGTAYFAKRSESFPLFGVAGPKQEWHDRYGKAIAHFARTIREMIRTKKPPFACKEVLEVVAVTHAAVKSAAEKGRVVALKEVL